MSIHKTSIGDLLLISLISSVLLFYYNFFRSLMRWWRSKFPFFFLSTCLFSVFQCLFTVSLVGVLSSLKKITKIAIYTIAIKNLLILLSSCYRGFWKLDFCWFSEGCKLWIENEFCSHYSLISAMRFMANISKTCWFRFIPFYPRSFPVISSLPVISICSSFSCVISCCDYIDNRCYFIVCSSNGSR